MSSDKQSCLDWHDTSGSPDWRKKVSALAETDVPSNMDASEYQNMSDDEREVYIQMLHNTRKRQNGDYPGYD